MSTQLFHAVQRTSRFEPANLQVVKRVIQHYVFCLAITVCDTTMHRLHTHTYTHTHTAHTEQEAQLMLTNPHEAYTLVKVTKHGTIRYVRYGFLLVCCSNFVVRTTIFKNAVSLKYRVSGPSKSLEMSQFDRAHTTSY